MTQMAAVPIRLVAMVSAVLVIPLAMVNWIHFGDSDLYVSGRQADVVFSFGDGYAIAMLGGVVILARLARTVWPTLDWLFPLACVVCGLGITAITGAVLFKDWAGERMWTLYTELALGIVIALSGTLLLTLRKSGVVDEQIGAANE